MWSYLAYAIIAMVVVMALLPKRTSVQNAEAQEFDTPTVEEGIPIPVVFGTCLISAPAVTWWGDLRRDPIKKKGGKK